jgi:hypothetical protein
VNRNLLSITPFFIVKDLPTSISHYVERLGFQFDFQGPEVPPRPNHTRHECARWDAYIYTVDPDSLFEELRGRGATFVKE